MLNVVCKKCGKEQTVQNEGFLNYKCSKCYTIQPFSTVPGVIWKCATGTAKRN